MPAAALPPAARASMQPAAAGPRRDLVKQDSRPIAGAGKPPDCAQPPWDGSRAARPGDAGSGRRGRRQVVADGHAHFARGNAVGVRARLRRSARCATGQGYCRRAGPRARRLAAGAGLEGDAARGRRARGRPQGPGTGAQGRQYAGRWLPQHGGKRRRAAFRLREGRCGNRHFIGRGNPLRLAGAADAGADGQGLQRRRRAPQRRSRAPAPRPSCA
jgi:hypothetical protein